MLTKTDMITLTIIIGICLLLVGMLRGVLQQKSKKQIQVAFQIIFGLMLLWLVTISFQIVLTRTTNISMKYFYDIYFVSLCFLPLAFLFMVSAFEKGSVKLRRIDILLFIIPTLTVILMWTNDYHHLLYKDYSSSLSASYGWYFYVHAIYTYSMFGIALIRLLRYTIINSGFFSKQAMLIIIGTLIPIIVNFLGSFKIIPVSIYATPISFSITILCIFIAMFKFNFLEVTPIALKKIVDSISDSYLILNNDNVITDFNATFLKTFKFKDEDIRKKDFFEIVKYVNLNSGDLQKFHSILNEVKYKNKSAQFNFYFSKIKKYFNIEISKLTSSGELIGVLILLKDTTQHMEDMQTIKNNQDMLIEQERLASLGQLIGGISHNLKTPIMSIAGATEGLNDLIKEYDASIGDPEVTEQDHHDIAKDMYGWTEKIKEYTEYMSDIITTVKGQAVTLSEDEEISFTIEELIKRVNILMRHELKNAYIVLNTKINIDENTTIKGDVNSLVQVVNNLISNAIQAYNGEQYKDINLIIDRKNDDIVISVQDFACGMPKEVQDKLFKEMVTTKGKKGSGLGLFMSYSTIKGHFRGEMTFESEVGKGTTFYITLPEKK